jgi:hypothetical protein
VQAKQAQDLQFQEVGVEDFSKMALHWIGGTIPLFSIRLLQHLASLTFLPPLAMDHEWKGSNFFTANPGGIL